MAGRNSNPLALPISIFAGKNYDIWSIKMKTYFLSQNLWHKVNPEIGCLTREQHEQQQRHQNDAAALSILQHAVDDNIFSTISEANTAEEAWEILKTEFQGNRQSIAISEQDRAAILERERAYKENWMNRRYPLVHNAILKGDRTSVGDFFGIQGNALDVGITVNLDTALHVAVGSKTENIVDYLLFRVPQPQLQTNLLLKNKEDDTVLSVAAIVGDSNAVKKIMGIDVVRNLLEDRNRSGRIPLVEAALHGHKEIVRLLLPITDLDFAYGTRFRNDYDINLIYLVITAEFYDLALHLLRLYEKGGRMQLSFLESFLTAIAGKPSAFPSGTQRKPMFWRFSYIHETNRLLQPILELLVTSQLKEIRETKRKHGEALCLVEHLCRLITSFTDEDENLYERISGTLKRPLLLAAELGVCEVVEEIINAFPDAIWFTNESNHNIFHLAVINRQEKVFNLISEMEGRKHLLLMSQDKDKNNILHLAGKLAPKNKLILIPGAALRMLRELQWFKEVQKILPPGYEENKNSEREAPAMVFTQEHKELVKEGEKWMKDAATSCSVAAALIATVVFTAAITVPGDYNDNGQPNYYTLPYFRVFAISNAVSLLSSVAAIIMFLSVLTARYAEDDFHRSLPNRLMLGFVSLLFSVASLMVAFSVIFYLVFCDKKEYWIFTSVFGAALVPLFLLAYWQSPIFWDLLKSTHRPNIFSQAKSNRHLRAAALSRLISLRGVQIQN